MSSGSISLTRVSPKATPDPETVLAKQADEAPEADLRRRWQELADEVRELVDASFRLVAPKKLIKQLDEV